MEGEVTNRTNTFVKGYCLYKHITNGRKIESSPAENTCEKTVPKLLAEVSTFSKNFSLSLLQTDLESEQEAKLQNFLIKRLCRSSVYSNTGSLTTLSNANISETPVICFYKLIKGPQLCQEDEKTTNMKVNEEMNEDFLVCFVANETCNLYLFQQELEEFCKGYEKTLASYSKIDINEFFTDLVNWYDINIQYVCRCTKLLHSDLALLISMGLLDEALEVLGCDEPFKSDIKRFVNVCSLSNLLSNPVIKESNQKILEDLIERPVEMNKLIFSESESSFHFEIVNNEDVCDICNDWSKTMTDGEQDDPIFLRQVMENYKLKVIQDMNALKRLLREAETDHYALFKSYMFLTKCPSSSIVMKHINKEAKMSLSTTICDVIQVLNEFISHKGGFSKIRSNRNVTSAR